MALLLVHLYLHVFLGSSQVSLPPRQLSHLPAFLPSWPPFSLAAVFPPSPQVLITIHPHCRMEAEVPRGEGCFIPGYMSGTWNNFWKVLAIQCLLNE